MAPPDTRANQEPKANLTAPETTPIAPTDQLGPETAAAASPVAPDLSALFNDGFHRGMPEDTDAAKMAYALSAMEDALKTRWNELMRELRSRLGSTLEATEAYLDVALTDDRDVDKYLADFTTREVGFDLERFRAHFYLRGLPDHIRYAVLNNITPKATREEIHERTKIVQESYGRVLARRKSEGCGKGNLTRPVTVRDG
ncbi:hypothetical protein BZA70DRAFT_268888 [Myxozyma melibiosi]|uniref:Retrotransposon gag domain-containing protein n=1 Tax=Myxozyma melibiosi TaxID=54550 RepID=A0ABR1F296_9ASCO